MPDYIKTNNGVIIPESALDIKSNGIQDTHQYAEFLFGNNTKNDTIPDNYASLAKTGYVENSTVSNCINLISQAVGNIPWIVRDTRTNEVVEDHPLQDLLDKPNVCMSGTEFFQTLQMMKLIGGDVYIRRIQMDNGNITELELLNPANVVIENGPTKLPLYYRYQPTMSSANAMRFPVDQLTGDSEICHIRFPHPTDPHYGLSPIFRAGRDIVQMNMGAKHNTSLLSNSATPSGVFSYGGNPDQSMIEQIGKDINRKFIGPENAGKPLVTGEVDWTPMGQSPRELDFNNTQAELIKRIASVFAVPAQLLNGDAQKYDNLAIIKLEFYENNVLNQANTIAQEFNNWLSPLFGEVKIDIDLDKILALTPRRTEIFNKYKGVEVLTDAERRLAIGVTALPVEPQPEPAVVEPVQEEDEEKSTVVKTQPANTLMETKSSGDDNHTHTFDANVKNGVTSPASTDGHTHNYTLGAKSTAVFNGHDHELG